MKKHALAASTILVMFIVQTVRAQELKNPDRPDATVHVQVVDDDGKPVRGTFSSIWSLSDMDAQSGKTNRRGIYSQKLKRIFPPIRGKFYKAGFYTSRGDIWKWEGDERSPTNTLTVTIKRIIDPVPMVFRDVTLTFPRLDEAIGYDLEVGDWVEPDGKGKVSDIMVTARKDFISWDNYDFRVMIEFAGELNGIQSSGIPTSEFAMQSALIPPQVAPTTGYSKTFEAWIGRPRGGQFTTSADEKSNHIFRVRTKCDGAGEIVSANVGWIIGPIATTPTEKNLGKCYFKYYWNPDPTSRSLEPKEIAARQGMR